MTGPTDDLSLIADCRAGRKDAFGPLVARYQDRLYPTALRLTGSIDDALDLLQDTFLRAYQKLGGFRGDSSFLTWTYRIMVNLARTERRKRHPRPLRGDLTGDAPDTSDASNPSTRLERAERESLVQNALDKLSADHRVVVVMKEFDGLRYEEIAAALDVPIGTVRSRLHRARGELKDALQGMDDANPSEPAQVESADPSSSSSLIIPFRGTRPTSSLALTPPSHHEP
jgi:RNA polymerase sigma-70 factor, ECF subfamily